MFIRMTSAPFTYRADDYRISRIKPAVIALLVVILALALLGPFVTWRDS